MSLVVLVIGCLLSGAVIGLLGGILGIGGGLIAIPALGLVLGMDQQLAQGTALVMVLPTVLMAVRKYNQQARIDLSVAAAGALSAMICTWLGARGALGMDPVTLRRSFAVFLFGVGAFYVWQTWRKPHVVAGQGSGAPAPALKRRQAVMLGVLAGTLGGFFGVGGAVIAVPVMTAVYKLRQAAAQALALTMIIPGACVALFTYARSGSTDWVVGGALAAGSLLLVPVGVRIAYRLPERSLRAAFAALLFVTVVLLLAEG